MERVNASGERTLLLRVEACMRATAALGRSVQAHDGFTVAIAGAADAAGLAVAVPTEHEPGAWAPALAAVRTAFAERSLTPRIEYVDELHPGLATAAHALGWRTSARLPVMVVAAPEPPSSTVPLAAEVRFVRADDEALAEFVRGQQRAYRAGAREPEDPQAADITAAPSDDGQRDAAVDDDRDTLAWMALLRQGMRNGMSDVVTVSLDGRLVAGASLVRAGDTSELTGVWTSLEMRGRSLARHACQALLEHAFAVGDRLVWLSAAPGATRLYAGLGFRPVARQRNLTYPAAP